MVYLPSELRQLILGYLLPSYSPDIPAAVRQQVRWLRARPEFLHIRGSDKQFLKRINYHQLLNNCYYPNVTAFNLERPGDKITLIRPISVHQYLARLESNQRQVIVNFRRKSKIFVWRRNNNLPGIWFSTSWFFWNQRILVQEYSVPIGSNDDALEVGRQILAQLTAIAPFATFKRLKQKYFRKTNDGKYWITSYHQLVRRFDPRLAYQNLHRLYHILLALNTESKQTKVALSRFKLYLFGRNSLSSSAAYQSLLNLLQETNHRLLTKFNPVQNGQFYLSG